jgi:hypothetical protein
MRSGFGKTVGSSLPHHPLLFQWRYGWKIYNWENNNHSDIYIDPRISLFLSNLECSSHIDSREVCMGNLTTHLHTARLREVDESHLAVSHFETNIFDSIH